MTIHDQIPVVYEGSTVIENPLYAERLANEESFFREMATIISRDPEFAERVIDYAKEFLTENEGEYSRYEGGTEIDHYNSAYSKGYRTATANLRRATESCLEQLVSYAKERATEASDRIEFETEYGGTLYYLLPRLEALTEQSVDEYSGMTLKNQIKLLREAQAKETKMRSLAEDLGIELDELSVEQIEKMRIKMEL